MSLIVLLLSLFQLFYHFAKFLLDFKKLHFTFKLWEICLLKYRELIFCYTCAVSNLIINMMKYTYIEGARVKMISLVCCFMKCSDSLYEEG